MAYKILTVDDSRTIRMIVKKAFEQYDCELFEAENGVEGLAVAAKVNPDLIVLDITMPVMTGIEMLGKLKEEEGLRAIPVIMLTAESGKDNVINIVKMGVKDYIVKPFKGEQLIERARQVLDLKREGQARDASQAPKPDDCFKRDGDFLKLSLPAKISRSFGSQIDGAVTEKIGQMNASWAHKLIIDLRAVKDIQMNVINLLAALFGNCTKSKIPACLVATPSQSEALQGFQETRNFLSAPSVEQAKTALSV